MNFTGISEFDSRISFTGFFSYHEVADRELVKRIEDILLEPVRLDGVHGFAIGESRDEVQRQTSQHLGDVHDLAAGTEPLQDLCQLGH